ncbi:hypothetical protein Tsubulata_051572 [Turnera subulata]|uniref:F-box domain-containing protein n=1 Tax=Turnera subulata TaxID=218843 RepID=A0A9Q0F2E5_9ROSI|nr:hypothetical protein Tsubulata_051572 [Turnera subulata]
MQYSKARKSSQLMLLQQLTEAIFDNNDDLLIEVLARLPVKSLLQFKTVSKRWLHLISSPEFCRRLYPDHHSASGILVPEKSSLSSPYRYDFISLNPKPTPAPFKALRLPDDPSGITILQSCNGLLLCCTSISTGTIPEVYNYYVYNPTTKQSVTIPHPFRTTTKTSGPCHGLMEGTRRPRHLYGLSLAFDPEKSPFYKIVCIRSADSVSDIGVSCLQIEIYSSQTRSWKQSGGPFPVNSGALFQHGVFCNGAIHWIGSWGSCFYFKVEEEQLQEMPMPQVPEDREERRCVYFGESRGHLHLVEIYKSPSTHFDVYEMKKDYSGWFVKYKVDLDAVATAFPTMVRSHSHPADLNRYVFDIVSVEREAKDDESRVLLHIPGAILSYNLKEKSFKKISDFVSVAIEVKSFIVEGSIRSLKWWGLYKFVESFYAV